MVKAFKKLLFVAAALSASGISASGTTKNHSYRNSMALGTTLAFVLIAAQIGADEVIRAKKRNLAEKLSPRSLKLQVKDFWNEILTFENYKNKATKLITFAKTNPLIGLAGCAALAPTVTAKNLNDRKDALANQEREKELKETLAKLQQAQEELSKQKASAAAIPVPVRVPVPVVEPKRADPTPLPKTPPVVEPAPVEAPAPVPVADPTPLPTRATALPAASTAPQKEEEKEEEEILGAAKSTSGTPPRREASPEPRTLKEQVKEIVRKNGIHLTARTKAAMVPNGKTYLTSEDVLFLAPLAALEELERCGISYKLKITNLQGASEKSTCSADGKSFNPREETIELKKENWHGENQISFTLPSGLMSDFELDFFRDENPGEVIYTHKMKQKFLVRGSAS